MEKQRTVMSEEFSTVTVGCLDVVFYGKHVDVYQGEREIAEISTDSLEYVPYGHKFAVPDYWDDVPCKFERWVPYNIKYSSEIETETLEDSTGRKCGITVYLSGYPMISVVYYNGKTYFYSAKQPKELNGSGIAFAPLTLQAVFG